MENNVFAIFLLGTSTQDGGKRERSNVVLTSCNQVVLIKKEK